MAEFHKFEQFNKLEENNDGSVIVWGIATQEAPDLDNEICMYDAAVPVYKKWSDAALKRTTDAGQKPSLGNVRLQHGTEIGGKAVKIEYDDAKKCIMLGAIPINDEVADDLRNGMYTGYSQGGAYAWRQCADCGKSLSLSQAANFCPVCKTNVVVKYGLRKIAEVSFVDSPCSGVGFDYVKSDGSHKFVKFRRSESMELTQEQIAAIAEQVKKAAEDSAARAEQEAARKAKIRAGFDARVERVAAAKGVEKGMYSVSALAEVLQSLAYLYESAVYERDYEDDDSAVPEALASNLDALIETFISMASEEAKELAASASGKSAKGESTTMTPEELEAMNKAAKKSQAADLAKSAHFHEQAAAGHEKMASTHQALSEALLKQDGETPVSDAQKANAAYHVSLAQTSAQLAKDSAAHAAHLNKMAEEADPDEYKVTVAAIKAATPIQKDEIVVKVAPVIAAGSIDADVAKEAEAQRQGPAYKEAVASIAKARLDHEIEQMRASVIIPDGARLTTASGDQLTAVQKGSNKPFEFASDKQSGDFGGL